MIKPEEGTHLHWLAPPVGASEELKEAWAAVQAVIAQRDRLHRALVDCANPLGMLQREAAEQGRELEGYFARLFSNDANFVKKIASDALEAENT